MEKVAIEYSSYAAPPDEFQVGVVYQCGEDKQGTYIIIDGDKVYYPFSVIKNLFTPINKKWEDVINPQKKDENKKQK